MALRHAGMRRLHFVGLLLALSMPAARAALFKYVDPVTRVASYTNYRPSQPGARELAPRSEASARTGAPRRAAPARMLGPADFPRVDAAHQHELDTDRRRIIADELLAVQAELARLLAGRASADRIGRHRDDVAALQRELARIK